MGDALSSGLTVSGLPVVHSISPDSGSIYGGTVVSLSGNGFGSNLDTTVEFGGAEAVIKSITQTSIECISPSNSAGSYDVQITCVFEFF